MVVAVSPLLSVPQSRNNNNNTTTDAYLKSQFLWRRRRRRRPVAVCRLYQHGKPWYDPCDLAISCQSFTFKRHVLLINTQLEGESKEEREGERKWGHN